ncbi:protein PELPK1-like isoform X3 [Telopea speciosissima]|uniref:protein PELPK1-like isoform X1 n=1 Tax=Telopea speciosissima TaxID=54955 RepID=UPI001CC50389|nr:protein PELPK1-like isoform X1 [Telopea speciosissima]XP_043702473.1 protein PELPK1-like isoform X2 [Telopea speciosissima]XP_043702474.1 protein PELPK1-like isoform X3 [Telopea speciosissima]
MHAYLSTTSFHLSQTMASSKQFFKLIFLFGLFLLINLASLTDARGLKDSIEEKKGNSGNENEGGEEKTVFSKIHTRLFEGEKLDLPPLPLIPLGPSIPQLPIPPMIPPVPQLPLPPPIPQLPLPPTIPQIPLPPPFGMPGIPSLPTIPGIPFSTPPPL